MSLNRPPLRSPRPRNHVDSRRVVSRETASRLPPDSLAWAMRTAAGLIVAVQEGQSLNELFERRSEGWPDVRRATVRDLAWRTLREFGRGDFILAACLSKPLPADVHAIGRVAPS